MGDPGTVDILQHSLGRFGVDLFAATNTIAGQKYCAFYVIEDTKFSAITGRRSIGQDAISINETFLAGSMVPLEFTGFTKTQGKIVCYRASW
jgi:hypothetical protein